MIDVSANLYNALPQTLGTANRLPASRSLVSRDESLAGSNSLRGISDGLRPATPAGDFSAPPANEQGFASLSPVLQSLQLPPSQLAPPPDETPLWRELLDQQQERLAARDQSNRDREALQQAQEQRAAERELLQQQFTNLSSNSVFEGEQSPPVLDAAQQAAADLQQAVPEEENVPPLPGQAQGAANDAAEAPPLPGQGASEDPAASQLGSFPPNTQFPGLQNRPAPEVEPFPELPQQPRPAPPSEQERVEQLFSGAGGTNNTGNNLNLFA